MRLANFRIPDVLLDRFCTAEFDTEACGVLIGKRRGMYLVVADSVVLPNRSDHPWETFKIDPRDIPEQHLGRVLCPVHTHPPPHGVHPSDRDLQGLKRNTYGIVLAPLNSGYWQASLYTANRTITTAKWK